MDKIIENTTSTAVTFGTSFGILFDNPYLISMAIISGLIGVWNAVANLAKENKLGKNIFTYDAILKGLFVGVLGSLIVTLVLVVGLDPVLNHYLNITITDERQVFTFGLYSLIGLLYGRKLGYISLKFLDKKGEKYD